MEVVVVLLAQYLMLELLGAIFHWMFETPATKKGRERKSEQKDYPRIKTI